MALHSVKELGGYNNEPGGAIEGGRRVTIDLVASTIRALVGGAEHGGYMQCRICGVIEGSRNG